MRIFGFRKTDPLEDYWRDAASWETDRVRSIERSERRAWRVSSVAISLAALSTITLGILSPLKTVVPYLVRVDSTTGVVDIVPELVALADVPETVTRYFITRYVSSCERYSHATAYADYAECGAFNSAERNQELYQRWSPTNPDSPLNIYGQGTTLRVQITSISFLDATPGQTVAQVRYLIGMRKAGTSTERLTHYIATVAYRYAKPSKDLKTRQSNPFGLRIESFRRELEVLNDREPNSIAAAPIAPAASEQSP